MHIRKAETKDLARITGGSLRKMNGHLRFTGGMDLR